jgi:uncharacterized protein YbjT (DUF2867 family)
MKVLVIGATGVLGRTVVRRLIEQGHAVRAMTRTPQKAHDLAALGAEVVAGDLVDRGSLVAACTDVDRVLAAAHSLLGRGRHASEHVDAAGHRALIDTARAAGVRRFVYTSALGAAPEHPVDFFRTKHAIELYLSASGMPHVILRPTAFMEQHVHEFNGKGLLDKGRIQLIGPGTKRRNFVAAADVAQFAVLALTADPAPGPVLEIMGPGNFSNNDVAALYARLSGKPLSVSHLPAGMARWLYKLAAPLHPGAARLLGMLGLPDDAFNEAFDSEPLQRAYPQMRLTTLEEFVQARVADAGGQVQR